jgi:hypothetical protein
MLTHFLAAEGWLEAIARNTQPERVRPIPVHSRISTPTTVRPRQLALTYSCRHLVPDDNRRGITATREPVLAERGRGDEQDSLAPCTEL